MNQQERVIVNEEEEEAKRNKSKILGIFSRANKTKNGSGASTPIDRKSSSATASKRTSYDAADEDDDDLPPREVSAKEGSSPSQGDLGMGQNPSTDSLAHAQIKAAQKAEEDAVRHIPKTAGFDFAAISKVLGKDIDVDKIKVDDGNRGKGGDGPQVSPIAVNTDGIERSTSVPPRVNISVHAAPEEVPRSSLRDVERGSGYGAVNGIGRSSSYSVPIRTEDDEGDITFGADTSGADVWGRRPSPPDERSSRLSPSALSSASAAASASASSQTSVWGKTSPVASPPISPPTSATSPFANIGGFGFNAWANSSSSSSSASTSAATSYTSGGTRAAPPARPHPPELSGIQGGFASAFTGAGTGSSSNTRGVGTAAAPPARPHPPELSFATSSTNMGMSGIQGGFAAAPPARPHPPELMANPFATTGPAPAPMSASASAMSDKEKRDNGVWGWGKRQKSLEDEAMNNPW